MNSEEKILGFDVRRNISPYFNWDEDRKDTYLIKKDIEMPLSVDHNVWEKQIGMVKKTENLDINFLGFYSDLISLKKKIKKTSVPKNTVVSIALCIDSEKKHEINTIFMIPQSKPNSKQPNWKFLGFDVADSGLVSALTNYGHSQRAKNIEFINHLNQYHLFEDYAIARLYAETAEIESVEKSRFYVFKLYQVS